MEVPRELLAVLEQGHLCHPLVYAGVVDSDTHHRRQRDREALVHVADARCAPLLGEVEVAEHLLAHRDRHAEEGAHRRMPGREAHGVGMGREADEPQGTRIGDEQAEDVPTDRAIPDPRLDIGGPTATNSTSLVFTTR